MKIYPIVKRIIDIVLSLFLMIAFFPLFLLIYMIVFVFVSPQVIFVQKRGGYKGKTILIYKFKTMKDSFDKDGNLLPDEQRLHAVGNILRKASLDELPQLLNVVLGDMSLIGPRPQLKEMMDNLQKIRPDLARRNEIRPGITGLAQINGRNSIKFSRRFEYDIEYIEKCSFMLDLSILLKTILLVIKRTDSTVTTNVETTDDLGICSFTQTKKS